MLANQLARFGISFQIVDRHSGPSVKTKALGVQARTLEIYAKLGIADEAVALGRRASGANLWANGRHSARIPLGDIGRDMSPFPYLLILGQDDNERLLGKRLRASGYEIQWNRELVGLEPQGDHVRCALRRHDGSTQTLRASWVAGCDGAHSAVRTLSRIEFPGAPYEHIFFVADTTASGPMVPGELNIYLLREGFHLFFPMRGENQWRVVGILPPELRARDDIAFDAVEPTIRAHVGAALNFTECRWLSTYRIHHRHAARFRDGRCFLLGDAAHVHSPVGAQGMNTGLQDAYNLGWKLAMVVRGRAHNRLLDSYEVERLPVARRLLETTDRAFSVVVSDRWLSRLLRTRMIAKIAATAMRFEATRRLGFRTISQIGIHYRRSPLSQTGGVLPRKSPQPGDRFPWLRLQASADSPVEDLFGKLDDTRFNLIAFGQQPLNTLTSAFGDLLRVFEFPALPENRHQLARVDIPERSYYLLRPDGHVGLAGIDVDSRRVAQYFEPLDVASHG